MNFSQNHFVPQNFPPQMVNSPLQYNEPLSFVGKVIRIRPNIYAFICDYCMSQHQSIEHFVRHTESHFQRNEISNAMPMAMPPVRPNQNSAMVPTGTSNDSNGPTVAPYPIQLQQSEIVSMNQGENYTDEVYEIIDLGYDFEGNYPNAKSIDEMPVAGNAVQHLKPKAKPKAKPKQRQSPSKSKVQHSKPNNRAESAHTITSKKCPYCVRVIVGEASLKRHMFTAHAKIFKKIDSSLKKCFKCKVCGEKFPKAEHTLEEAQEHLKIHYSK